MKYKPPFGYEIDVLEVRPLTLENLSPMVHKYALRHHWLQTRVQIKVQCFGEPAWITVDKTQLTEK